MRRPTRSVPSFALALAVAASGVANRPSFAASLFDPARHMHVSEVRAGMKGYGETVFTGTKLERFDVEVLSVLHNFNPKHDVVLIRCFGATLEHTGSIAGMSGSPIYLFNDAGKPRMIGAFAYGWALTKDPIAGVQPIEYMLDIPVNTPASQPAGGFPDAPTLTAPPSQGKIVWSVDQAVLLPGMKAPPPNYPLATLGSLRPNPQLLTDTAGDASFKPLATPLMTAGLPPRLVAEFAPLMNAYGLVPLQAGGGGGSAGPGDAPVDDKLVPGAVLALPLLVGDIDMTAIGTVTEVVGDRVFGFGHPFQGEGPVSLPLGAGTIASVIPNLATSFKLGSLTGTVGTLTADNAVGVAGITGRPAPTVPIDFRVVYADGSVPDTTYHYTACLHPRFTALLAAFAMNGSITGQRELPQYHTLNYTVELTFDNGKSVRVDDTSVNAGGPELFFELGTPLIAATDNPFRRVMPTKISGTVTVTPEAREADILDVNVPKLKYRPGETVRAYVTYRPFRAAEAILPVELAIPAQTPDGTYTFSVSDWQTYLDEERTTRPFRFAAENIDQVFDALRELASIRHDAVYLRLTRQPDGIAVGRTAMPHLPSSRRQVLLDGGRSNTTAFVSSTVKVVPTERVMSGQATFQIEVDRNAGTEGAPSKGPKHDLGPVKRDTPKPATPQKPAAAPAGPPGEG